MTRRLWLAAVIAGCADPAPVVSLDPFALSEPLAAPARSWRPLVNTAPFGASAPLLLTDGTVMIHEFQSENWWRLTPDVMGGYANGTWSPRASMQAGYSPLYFASAVLPDGRVIVEGGEYIAGGFAFSTDGAIYDPVADRWQQMAPPLGAGWERIGDASGMVLANGTFMLSACCSSNTALLDARSLTWRPVGDAKADIHDEESWAMLPDGSVLTVDANNTLDLTLAERYDPALNNWVSAGHTPIQISDLNPDGSGSHEVGPEVLRPDGTVLAIGGLGHNAIYDTATQTWSAAPDMPMVGGQQLGTADGPAASLPNGNVLVVGSPGVFGSPSHYFEWDGATFMASPEPPNAKFNSSYSQFMLMLPTGELLLTDFSTDVELYTPAPGVPDNAVPVILDAPVLVDDGTPRPAEPQPVGDTTPVPVAERPVTSVYLGRTYVLSGKRLSGVSQGAYYGDDQQSYTNFPIVRLTNLDTNHVTYCRTHDHSTMLVSPDAHGTTRFDVPPSAERGLANLVVIANGIASPPVIVNVK
jgi:hypothetical protein